MDYESFKGIGKQLGTIWRGLKPLQQLSLIAVTVLLLGFFSYIIVRQSYPAFIPLFPNEKLQLSDSEEITNYLDHMHIPYKIDANASVLVPVQDVQKARAELTTLGIPKGPINKGYDLFDNSTWIRGEKELQILEIRALKGQLEQDISQYDNIRSSYVILDIAPSRPFGSASPYRTKASIILNLIPGTTLSQSEIQAITYHVAGAVRGLMPNMVAISDTTGKLYQGWDPQGEYDNQKNAKLYFEDQLKGKIDGLLSMIAGPGRYYSTIQVMFAQEPTSGLKNTGHAEIDSIYVSIVLESQLLEGDTSINHEQQLRSTIEKQVIVMLEPYHSKVDVSINFASFMKGISTLYPSNYGPNYTDKNLNELGSNFWTAMPFIVVGLLSALIVAIAWFITSMMPKLWKGKKLSGKSPEKQKPTDIDLELMLESLKEHIRVNPKVSADEIRSVLTETHQDK